MFAAANAGLRRLHRCPHVPAVPCWLHDTLSAVHPASHDLLTPQAAGSRVPLRTRAVFQPIVIALFADPLLRTEFPIIQGAIFALLHKLPPRFHSVCVLYLHDFCHPLFLPFSRKTYRKFFDIWEDFRTPFSFVPAVPLLSAYHYSVGKLRSFPTLLSHA